VERAAGDPAFSDLGKLVAATPLALIADDLKKGLRRLSAVIVGHCFSPMDELAIQCTCLSGGGWIAEN
jgi:hypothetical protein